MKQQHIHNYSAILRQSFSVIILLTMFLFSSCSQPASKTTLPTHTIIADVSRDNVKATISMIPDTFKLNQDISLIIKIEMPITATATIPDLSTYFTGFKLTSDFVSPIVIKGNKVTYSRHLQLIPQISTLYAIKPFIINYKDRSYNPALTGSIKISETILTPKLPKINTNDIIVNFIPIESETAQKAKTAKIIAALLLLIIIFLQAAKYHFNNRAINIPPTRSAALINLQKLLNSSLITDEKFNEFYFTLTAIVRCYIEEALEIPSTHQTSEELIKTLQKDPRINEIMLSDLKKFFQRADLIKFATLNPTAIEIANDIAWAEKYIETDFQKNEMEAQQS